MAEKKTGISHDLLIHPGETIAELIEERGITQAELAFRTGVSCAYVSNVISGKKGISAKFAMGLEYAFGVPKSFWLNLQANYEAELLEADEECTISEEEYKAREELKDVVKYLRQDKRMPSRESKKDSILSLRRVFQISDISHLKEIVPEGSFRISNNVTVNPYVLGAWIRLCQLSDDHQKILTRFDKRNVNKLIHDLKEIMCQKDSDIQADLKSIFEKNGINFSIVKNFKGAPVHGYICKRDNDVYQMVLTIRGSYADIFWFSLFHEIGHIVNEDVGKNLNFIDYDNERDEEKAADTFASNMLLSPDSYQSFIKKGDFSINSIIKYAHSQEVMPYIVIGRLQREKYLDYNEYANYKVRYKWPN